MEVKNWLGAAGYNPQYGARPMARLIENEILNKLAVLILKGEILNNETAKIILQNGRPFVVPNHLVESDESSSEDDMEVDETDEEMFEEEPLYD
jgi:ATP-dependent Clp protease ATP-binding subunit ClpA